MDACDALGVQSAWFFLAIGFLVGPLALLISAVQDPTILTSLKRSQRAAFATIWKNMADPLDKRYAKYKAPFMKDISGVVLDLGSGLGQNLKYLDASKISRLLLVEPNPGMHEGLRKNALAAGFKEGQFQIVPCGAEEKAKVEQFTGLGHESVDSVVSLLALCGIPESKRVIAALYDYLKPGGTFYFFEHVASKHAGARSLQDRLNPLWKFLFGGCNLNRATDKWILESFEWAETKEMSIDFENEKALDPKAYGWAKKPARQQ
ncbi:S-adenosyl-L-methionine-dependent methyltransferase [Cystobasidium minutum MCA 4210]|uniref:S-adenosyl-L-methionine-dependent methyltransferase n=1 Tax=Cystobasidium minutum MCA 4210 TaxID=1397322 RepID=UPI0034CDE714|eukprot:jgi/Rhomi1/170316/fgenesh1_kg.4_\